MAKGISMRVIRRLPRYHRFLSDLDEQGVDRISSNELSTIMRSTASQVRQDLNCFGGFGQQGYGYPVKQLKDSIGAILGLNKNYKSVLFGAGNLGRAVATHMNFDEIGFDLCGIFERDERLIGTTIRGIEVMSEKDFKSFCNENHIQVVFLCLPQDSVTHVIDDAYSIGIRYYWNFSHFDIHKDYPDTIVENVHIGDSLMTLCYKITAEEKE